MKAFVSGLTRLAKLVIVILLSSTLLVTSCPTHAIARSDNPIPSQTPPPEPPTDFSETQATPGLYNSQELEAFLDSFLPKEMQQEHVLGGVVSVVKDGEIFLTKGYGFTNPDKTQPVEGDRTLFRVASLSKLFTDTAVMQLYERGLIDLEADVNQYLQAFKIHNPYSQPVTSANLMTQTDGTTQRLLEIAAPTAAKMTPLETFIPARMPSMIFPPGEIYSYSNMGITLAGYLVQTLSQTPFIKYIEQNILQPLDMQHSTFQQPIPSNLQADLSPGFRYQDQHFKSYPFLYFNIAPAAALSATASDMAHFMIAHLQNGAYGKRRILKEETTKLMHEQHFTHHPKLPGTAYGFHEHLENNLRMIGHAGNMPGYSSSITLIPEQNVGVFTAFNSYNPAVPGKVLTRLLDRYFPAPKPAKPDVRADVDLQRFTGSYRDLEYPRDTLAKITAPFGHIHITSEGSNQLSVETPGLYFSNSVTRRRLVPVGALLFKQVDDDSYTAFAEGTNGKITYVFNPVYPKIGAFEKVRWYETVVFQLWFAGICAVILLSACFVHPINRWLNRSAKSKPPRRFTRYAHWNAALAGGLYLVPLIASGLFLWLTGPWKLAYGIPIVVTFLLHLLPIAAVLSFGLLIWSIVAWKKNYWSWQSRFYYWVVTSAAILFIPFLHYWNFLTIKT